MGLDASNIHANLFTTVDAARRTIVAVKTTPLWRGRAARYG